MPKKAPPKKAKSPKDLRPQRERFIEFAREHGADDPGALDKAFGEIEKAPKSKPPPR